VEAQQAASPSNNYIGQSPAEGNNNNFATSQKTVQTGQDNEHEGRPAHVSA